MKNKKSIIESFGMTILVTTGLLLGIELFVRITDTADPKIYFSEIFAIKTLGDMQPSHFSIGKDKAGNEYKLTTNKLGFRSTGKIVALPKKTILCIGDSYTLGILDDEKTYPYILQQLVRDKSYQVYNAGFPGYTLEDELNYLNEKGLSVNPDIIILAFCKNDFTDYAHFWRKSFRRIGRGVWRKKKANNFFKRNIHILSLAKKVKIKMIKKELSKTKIKNIAFDVKQEDLELSKIDHDELKKYRNKYADDFKQFYELCINKNIKILPVIFPSTAQINGMENLRDQEFLLNLFSSHGLQAIDLFPDLKNFDADSIFIKGDGHPTELANRILVEKLTRVLESM